MSRCGNAFVPLAKIPGLDPSQVPALSISDILPPVPLDRIQARSLRQRFTTPPRWEPEKVNEKRREDSRVPISAAVLVGIVQRREPTLLLTQRGAHLKTHSGQIAFPGGKQDPQDESLIATALRESHEEVGLDPHHIEVLGTLPTYVTGTSFVITPVVALIHDSAVFKPNPEEVADVFEVPLHFLMNSVNHRWHQYEWEGQMRNWYSMPYHDGTQQRFIWGATAGMLRNLYRFLLA